MNLLELLRQFAAECTHPAGSPERIAALRARIDEYRTANPDETVDLAALDTAAMEAFEELRAGDLTAQTLADMQTLADVCDGARELGAADAEAQAAIAAQAEALAGRVGTAEPAPAEGEPDEGGEPAPEPEPGDGEGNQPNGEPVPEPALVASARRTPRVPLGNLPNHRRATPAGQRPGGYVWQAAADIRGVQAGAELTTSRQLVEATVQRMSSYGRTGTRGEQRGGIAVIRRDGRHGQFITDNNEVSTQMLADLTDEGRLQGGSLVAAGGWCAPSEVRYDLLPGADPDAGMIDIPTITSRRGGIRWPISPSFATLYADSGTSFYQSEATVIAGATPKPCYEIPCTTFNEERLGVVGVCVRSPILTERGYPELVEATIDQIMAVHAHKVNQRKIAEMVADATANTVVAADIGFAGYSATLLSLIELQVEYLRYRHRWQENTTLELVLPLWARGTVRADLAGRNAQPFEAITDAQVDAYLRSRGVNPQWVYDWQDSFATGQAGDFGGTTAPKRFPATLSMLIYRAGTYFAAENDVITIDGLYDSALLEDNMHLALFTEEGLAIGKRDWPAILLTVPVYPGGYSGEQIDPPLFNLIPDPA